MMLHFNFSEWRPAEHSKGDVRKSEYVQLSGLFHFYEK